MGRCAAALVSVSNVTLPLADLYNPIRGELAVAGQIFDAELNGELSFINALCDSVRSFRGKMLRPALLLLVAKAVGRVSPDHHTLAAVVEMVHIATLVHDDVLDEADERRGRTSINSAHGNVDAVLLGDYLISHAYHLCSGLDHQHAARCIAAATNTVCEGELMQNHNRGNADLSEPLYFEIIRRKTGALTAACCELGAHYAGADDIVVGAMRAYGMSAGVAFQIVDDVLDIVGDQKKVRKTLGRDAMLGKPTLPTIHCLAHGDAGSASIARSAVAGGRPCDPEQLGIVLKETGSIDYALSVATEYVDDALSQLDSLAPSEARSSLIAMAEFIVRRQF